MGAAPVGRLLRVALGSRGSQGFLSVRGAAIKISQSVSSTNLIPVQSFNENGNPLRKLKLLLKSIKYGWKVHKPELDSRVL